MVLFKYRTPSAEPGVSEPHTHHDKSKVSIESHERFHSYAGDLVTTSVSYASLPNHTENLSCRSVSYDRFDRIGDLAEALSLSYMCAKNCESTPSTTSLAWAVPQDVRSGH